MSKDPKFQTVATAVRIEHDESKDDLFIVFKVVDPSLKQRIRENWLSDIELKLIDKNLIIKE